MREIADKFFCCPNCLGIYRMVPVVEIALLCKRCRWKNPKKRLCKRGVNQLTKMKRCVWWAYNAGGKRKR